MRSLAAGLQARHEGKKGESRLQHAHIHADGAEAGPEALAALEAACNAVAEKFREAGGSVPRSKRQQRLLLGARSRLGAPDSPSGKTATSPQSPSSAMSEREVAVGFGLKPEGGTRTALLRQKARHYAAAAALTKRLFAAAAERRSTLGAAAPVQPSPDGQDQRVCPWSSKEEGEAGGEQSGGPAKEREDDQQGGLLEPDGALTSDSDD